MLGACSVARWVHSLFSESLCPFVYQSVCSPVYLLIFSLHACIILSANLCLFLFSFFPPFFHFLLKCQLLFPSRLSQATLATMEMDLDLILHPSSIDDLVRRIDEDPLLRQLSTPSVFAAVRSEAAAEHATALRKIEHPWTNFLDEEEEEQEEELIDRMRLTNSEEKEFRENPHWKHLLWTLDDNVTI